MSTTTYTIEPWNVSFKKQSDILSVGNKIQIQFDQQLLLENEDPIINCTIAGFDTKQLKLHKEGTKEY